MQRLKIHEGSDQLPVSAETFLLNLHSGQVILVTGPNGVGKSAFLDEIYRSTTGKSERLAGFRQIHFQSSDIDDIGFNSEHLRTNLGQFETYSRFRNQWSEQHLKSFMRRFREAILQALNDAADSQKAGASFEEAQLKCPSPLNQLNAIFRAALLPVQIVVQGGTLHAEREGTRYTVDRMSDGERAALLMVSAALTQPHGNYFIVDEPERHLNPAIAAPLISAVVRTRPDLVYVFSSHDVSLIEALQPTSIVHVRNSRVIAPSPEVREYDLQLISISDGLPADLKVGLIGSRRSLLLTEGTDSSDDLALYSLIFPGWQVLARGGNQAVTSDVPSINAHGRYTWLSVAGLVDGDGRSESEKAALAEKEVFSLPCPTIENLYLHQSVLEEMAEHIAVFEGGRSPQDRITYAYERAKEEIQRGRADIVARRAAWLVNRLLSERKVSVQDVKTGQATVEGIDLAQIRRDLEAELDTQLDTLDVPQLLFSVPVKNSGVPAKVAEAIGFANFRQYRDAVLSQMEQKTERGDRLTKKLRTLLPLLPSG